MSEYIRGIGEPLPEHEHVLWQGAPERGSLTRHVFHARKVALYFLLLMVTGALTGWVATLACAALAIGLSYLLGWLAARTSWYAITNHRVILRTGIVLSGVLNIPLRYVQSASIRHYHDGSGDLALALQPDMRLAYLRLWPHARPWRITRPQPALRGLPDVDRVGAILRSVVS